MAEKVIEGGMSHFFEPFRFLWLKKWAISVKSHVIEILRYFEIEPSRLLMHMTSRETCLIRRLFQPSHHTPCIIQAVYRKFSDIFTRNPSIAHQRHLLAILWSKWKGFQNHLTCFLFELHFRHLELYLYLFSNKNDNPFLKSVSDKYLFWTGSEQVLNRFWTGCSDKCRLLPTWVKWQLRSHDQFNHVIWIIRIE